MKLICICKAVITGSCGGQGKEKHRAFRRQVSVLSQQPLHWEPDAVSGGERWMSIEQSV